jgi:hypothetical protein
VTEQQTPPDGGKNPDTQEVYHGDKIVATLRLLDPGQAPKPGGRDRVIPGGPLYDLAALQAKLRSAELDLGKDMHCYVATHNCSKWLDKLEWTPGNQVTRLLLLLRPRSGQAKGDFYKSEWCTDKDDIVNPCDVYRVRVDEFNDWKRDVNAPLYYVKFSIEEAGQICLVLISCHLDKP